MTNARAWLWALLVLGCLTANFSPSTARADEPRRSEWRHHDGHWSYWHEGDKRWYYTDGSNWFYNEGDAWKTYRFDKQFGKEGFERGEYKVPGEGVEVVTPRHRIYVPVPR